MLEIVREYLNDIKLKLKNAARLKFNVKERFEIALPVSGKKAQPKTRKLADKHDILRRYAHNLNNLKIFKENTQTQKGSSILRFNNPL